MQGKSFIIAVFCCIRCILYPGTRIVIASKTRGQAIEIISKIDTILKPNSANLRAEIKKITNNAQECSIEFENTSIICVATANDNARHNRANVIVVDEFRMVDKATIDTVLRKFLTAPRNPGYLRKPEYSHLIERNMEIYLSSAWMKSHWSYEKLKAVAINMMDDTKRYFCCGLPYQLSIKENLLSKDQIADEMSETDFNEITFRMEMSCEWLGNTGGSLFNFDDIYRQRKVKNAWYPPEFASKYGQKFEVPKKQPGEIRILTADIALMSSRHNDNDATCIVLNSATKTGTRYASNITYTENIEGIKTQDLALKLRKYFEYFDCDYLGIDCKGLGIGVCDCLLSDIYDPETGHTYPAVSCANNEEIASRCTDRSAPKVIYAIMGSASFNSDAALSLREAFRQGRLHLLASEYECEDCIATFYPGYNKLSPTEKIDIRMPYINTGLMVNELINLQSEAKNNIVRVYEKPGARKDRYSSLSYNYWITRELERKIPKNSKTRKIEFSFRPPVLR